MDDEKCMYCKNFVRAKDGLRGGIRGICKLRRCYGIRSGKTPACKRFDQVGNLVPKIRKDGEYDYIPVGSHALKKRIGRYVVYDYEWLLEHLDTELKVLRESKEWRDKRDAQCRNDT